MLPQHRSIILNQNKRTRAHTYNIKNGLRNWRKALHDLDSQDNKIEVCILGDSLSEGQLAGSGGSLNYPQYLQYGYPGLLRTHFNNLYDDVGKGFIPIHMDTGSYPMVTYGGTWSFNASYGNMKYMKRALNLPGNTATINFNGTGIRIYGMRSTNATSFEISIDGGDPYTFSEAGALRGWLYYDITDLEPGDHTAVLTVVGNEVYLGGYREIKGTKGVHINNNARGGRDSRDAVPEAQLAFVFDQFQPTLTILSFLSNDYGAGIYDTYKSNLQTIISRAKQYGDVLITSVGIRGGVIDPPHLQSEYVQNLYDLAFENNCGYVDIFTKWGGGFTPANNLGFLADGTHPNTAGHLDIGEILIDVLMQNF